VPLVLICIAQETEKDAAKIEDAVRELYPRAADVLVAHVIDLHKVPSLFRKVAEGVLASEYKKAVEALREGQEPADYVVMLPDWQGEFAPAFNLPDPSAQIGGAVISPDGDVMGTYVGTDARNVLMLVDYALTR
jgi:hypothetical protein